MLDILPAAGVEQVQSNGDITIVEAPGTNWTGVRMNFTRPPWDNIDARMAVAKAIDRQRFVETAFFGLAVPAVGPLAPAFGQVYVPAAEVDSPQALDLDEAKALAEQAGLRGLQPQILIAADDPRAAEVLVNMLGDIGLEAQVDAAQTSAYFDRWRAGDYDMNITGSVVDADPDDGTWNFFHTEGPWNSQGYVSDEVDALLEEERAATDEAERTRVFQELQRVVQADVPFAFLYHEPDRTAFHTDVQGYVPIPEQRYLETVWLDR
jgi:peptide/nickel transport system substrate-binding protein